MTIDSRRGRVLIIDDDARVRQLFADCLAWLGHEVQTVESGTAGLALLETRQYDVVLTDLAMPGMSGLEVAETLRTLYPAMPIIVVSGSASSEDRRRMEARGLAFLCKPVHLRKFEEAIRTALDLGPRPVLQASA